jgi:iron(III) transport system ATP-binding protein
VNIEIKQLTMSYGDTVAVDSLDLDVQDGELLVLLGPSGCGKTTTMRCIAGLEHPTEGRISIGDTVVFDAGQGISTPTHRRQVGMVFQSYAIWPHMTVAENVSFPLRMQKVPRAEIRDRVAQVLDLVGLGGYEARGASKLSGGQMQRVAVARSVVMQPKVLLFDEPLSNLDAKLRDKLRFELRELQQSLGITSVYVTHDQSEAISLADRVVVMRAGRIVQLDDPRTLYRNPASTFVADFLGVDNILRGRRVGPRELLVDAEEGEGGVSVHVDQPIDDGDEVYVCFRSEDVAIRDHRPDREQNAWSASVTSYSYLGSHVRYQLSVDGGPRMYAMDDGNRPPFPRGTQVFLEVRPDALRVLES